MSQKKIEAEIARRLGKTRKESDECFNTVIEVLKEAIADNNSLVIRNFGTFKNYTRAGRRGRNPQTGEQIWIDEKQVVSFKAGKDLSALIN